MSAGANSLTNKEREREGQKRRQNYGKQRAKDRKTDEHQNKKKVFHSSLIQEDDI